MRKLFALMLLVTAIAVTGCGGKKETPKANPAPPAGGGAAPGGAAPEGGAAPAATPPAEPGK